MTETLKTLLCNQFEATFSMLERCLRDCPPATWSDKVLELKFDQVAFHALIFTDLYLDESIESMRDQAFHRSRREIFADYEELEEREQRQNYDREFVLDYLAHCRSKARRRITEETVESLAATSPFPRQAFTRAELLALTFRHLQHHTAQLSLRVRQDGGAPVGWISSGTPQ